MNHVVGMLESLLNRLNCLEAELVFGGAATRKIGCGDDGVEPNQHRTGGQLLESAYVDTAAYKAKKYGRSLTSDGQEKKLKE